MQTSKKQRGKKEVTKWLIFAQEDGTGLLSWMHLYDLFPSDTDVSQRNRGEKKEREKNSEVKKMQFRI